jgi:hypothetical protein
MDGRNKAEFQIVRQLRGNRLGLERGLLLRQKHPSGASFTVP